MTGRSLEQLQATRGKSLMDDVLAMRMEIEELQRQSKVREKAKEPKPDWLKEK